MILTFEKFCKEIMAQEVIRKDEPNDRVMFFNSDIMPNQYWDIRKDMFQSNCQMVHTVLYRMYHETYLPQFS